MYYFTGLLHVWCMSWEVKVDMSGQSNDCLRVCNVKMKKFLPGQKWGTFPRIYKLLGRSVKRFELIFSKMLKLDEKEYPDPQMSDFVKFSTLACYVFFVIYLDLSLFCLFLKAILV